ncbi:replication factor C small subunit [Thermogladius sp. KZ2Tp1]|uniref:replication factor C small subunit n=1 Tax=Thermogladius sp. KZ2Tp1 TaxID=3136289 RepID=UPI003DA9FFAD
MNGGRSYLSEQPLLLWAEKYRPRTLDEVVNQKEVVARLKKFVEEKNMPHLLFAGPPGTGKTTLAHCLAHDLYGDNYRQYMLELNASDERGIDVIRSKVKEFARTRVAGEVPFKIILLDEADNMTADAQQALRRLMELYTATTRFILIANYPSKIIEPIQSRCAVFRFTPLSKEDVVERLRYIAEKENVKYSTEALETIYELSEGDMRKAINILQAASALGEVTVEAVYKVVGLAHPKEVRQMLQLALSGNFTEARSKLRELMLNYGLSGLDIIKQVHREIFSSDIKLSDEARIMIADYAGEIQFRLVEGADDEIQLNAFLARLAFMGKKFRPTS